MRVPLLLAVALLCSACGSVEYHDTNVAVDANPLCAGSNSDRDGKPAISSACERKSEVEISSEANDDAPLDLSGHHDD